MVKEHTWSAWHCQDVGVGSLKVCLALVVVAICVVVIHKSHRVAFVVGIGGEALTVEPAPLSTAYGIVDIIFQREVEGSTLYYAFLFCAVNPILHQRHISVPIFSDGIGRFCGGIVESCVFWCVAFNKIVAESLIAHIVFQEVKIGVDVLLHVLARMVEVSRSVPFLTGVGCTCRAIAFRGTLVVLADV